MAGSCVSHLAGRSFSRYKNAMSKKELAIAPDIGFIETMDCLPISKLPEGSEWTDEIKFDGYRLETVRNAKGVTLYSPRRNVLNDRFGCIATALEYLPARTVFDPTLPSL
jgi:ATP-dependent DNA ligase